MKNWKLVQDDGDDDAEFKQENTATKPRWSSVKCGIILKQNCAASGFLLVICSNCCKCFSVLTPQKPHIEQTFVSYPIVSLGYWFSSFQWFLHQGKKKHQNIIQSIIKKKSQAVLCSGSSLCCQMRVLHQNPGPPLNICKCCVPIMKPRKSDNIVYSPQTLQFYPQLNFE